MADSRPPARRRTRDVAPGASTQMAKTAGLVLVAILLGVLMLNIIDDGSVTSATKSTTTSTTVPRTTTTRAGSPRTTTTLRPTGAVRAPGQIRIVVFNAGSGVTGAATTMTNALKTKGYVNHGTAGNTTTRTGRAVACRGALVREAAALATAVGGNATVIPFPASPPAGVDSTIDCLVLLGKTG